MPSPPKTARDKSGTLSKSERFLQLMIRTSAAARQHPKRPGYLCVAGERQSISGEEAAELVSRGLAAWRTPSELVASDAASSWSLRQDASSSPYRAQHGDIRSGSVNQASIDAAESPLLWLHRRKDGSGERLIGDSMFAAGERLRNDFTYGGMTPRMSVNWSGTGGGDGGYRQVEPTENALAARQRLRKAMDCVGPELSGVLLDVCCFLKRLEDVERNRRWPARSAKVILSLGLERLARHYGYSDCATGPVRKTSTLPPERVPPRR